MGFWIFMLIMDALIPAAMIGLGHHFVKHMPQKINGTFGYRTTMSMKNMETWRFAHCYAGKLWHVTGWVLLVLSMGAMALVVGREEAAVGAFGGILCGVQLMVLLGTVFPTETALKKTFDQNGRRR